MDSGISNKTVIEKIEKEGPKFAAMWLMREAEVAFPESSSKVVNTYQLKISRLHKESKRLAKAKHTPDGKSKYKTFLAETFKFPAASKESSDCSKDKGSVSKFTTDVVGAVTSKLVETEESLATERELCEQLQKKVKTLENKNEALASTCKEKSKTLKRARSSEQYHRLKATGLETYVEESHEDERRLKKTEKLEMTGLRDKIDELEYEDNLQQDKVKYLESEIVRLQSDTVNIYDSRRQCYNEDLQKCVHKLLEHNVSASQVSSVIQICVEFAGKKLNHDLPSESTIRNMNLQRGIISSMQIREEIPPQENLTLSTDEASHYGRKYATFNITTPHSKLYIFGLRDLLTKGGKDTLDVFKDILSDLDKVYYKPEIGDVSQDILFHLRNVMSDRASSEKKFGELLEAYRREVLPKVKDDWNELAGEVQEKIAKMHFFYCVMHVLVHFAESDNYSLIEAETAHFNGKIPIHDVRYTKKSESGTLRLIRTTCKAFAFGGDPKAGCHSRFLHWLKPWLKERSLTFTLTRFSHNRFNILHHNAVVVYGLHEKMKEFLKDDQSNQWVLFDLKQPYFIAGCKALGLICKLVTTPLWRLLERKHHIFDMNLKYLELTSFLKDACTNIEDFMSGKMKPFEDIPVKEDYWFHELLKPSVYDDDCVALLSVMLPALTKLAQERFKDQLPGGIYAKPTKQLREETESVPVHNKMCETVFARADFLLHNKPNISTIAMESYVMFSFNKTLEWLEGKDKQQQEEIMRESYKEVKHVRERYLRRKEELSERRADMIRQKLQEAEKTRLKREAERLELVQQITYHGLWQDIGQIDRNLATYKKKGEKIKALKTQLKFRKIILEQTPPNKDSTIYNFSVKESNGKRRDLTPDELKQNVIKLVEAALDLAKTNPPKEDNPVPLSGKKIRHKFEGDTWYNGEVISQVPGYPAWYNVVYDGDSSVYTYQLREDLAAGDLIVE